MNCTVTIASFEPLAFQFAEPLPELVTLAHIMLPDIASGAADEPQLTINIVSQQPIPVCDIGEIITKNRRQLQAVYDTAREEYRQQRRRLPFRSRRG